MKMDLKVPIISLLCQLFSNKALIYSISIPSFFPLQPLYKLAFTVCEEQALCYSPLLRFSELHEQYIL